MDVALPMRETSSSNFLSRRVHLGGLSTLGAFTSARNPRDHPPHLIWQREFQRKLIEIQGYWKLRWHHQLKILLMAGVLLGRLQGEAFLRLSAQTLSSPLAADRPGRPLRTHSKYWNISALQAYL